jgi:hypothetical protein
MEVKEKMFSCSQKIKEICTLGGTKVLSLLYKINNVIADIIKLLKYVHFDYERLFCLPKINA